MLGAAKGYKVVIAMPRLQSMHERYCVIKSFGAEILLSDPAEKGKAFLDLAEEVCRKPSGGISARAVYESQQHCCAPKDGEEIWNQMMGDVDAVVVEAAAQVELQ